MNSDNVMLLCSQQFPRLIKTVFTYLDSDDIIAVSHTCKYLRTKIVKLGTRSENYSLTDAYWDDDLLYILAQLITYNNSNKEYRSIMHYIDISLIYNTICGIRIFTLICKKFKYVRGYSIGWFNVIRTALIAGNVEIAMQIMKLATSQSKYIADVVKKTPDCVNVLAEFCRYASCDEIMCYITRISKKYPKLLIALADNKYVKNVYTALGEKGNAYIIFSVFQYLDILSIDDGKCVMSKKTLEHADLIRQLYYKCCSTQNINTIIFLSNKFDTLFNKPDNSCIEHVFMSGSVEIVNFALNGISFNITENNVIDFVSNYRGDKQFRLVKTICVNDFRWKSAMNELFCWNLLGIDTLDFKELTRKTIINGNYETFKIIYEKRMASAETKKRKLNTSISFEINMHELYSYICDIKNIDVRIAEYLYITSPRLFDFCAIMTVKNIKYVHYMISNNTIPITYTLFKKSCIYAFLYGNIKLAEIILGLTTFNSGCDKIVLIKRTPNRIAISSLCDDKMLKIFKEKLKKGLLKKYYSDFTTFKTISILIETFEKNNKK